MKYKILISISLICLFLIVFCKDIKTDGNPINIDKFIANISNTPTETSNKEFTIDNMFDNLNLLLKGYTSSIEEQNGFLKIYLISPVVSDYPVKTNNYKEDLKENDVFFSNLKNDFLIIDNNHQINLYLKKARNPNVPLKSTEYITQVTLFSKKEKTENIIWELRQIVDIDGDLNANVLDLIISKDLKRAVIVYEDYLKDKFVSFIDIDKMIRIDRKLPPFSSVHTFGKEVRSARIWTNNSIRFTFEDESIEHYMLLYDAKDVEKNKKAKSLMYTDNKENDCLNSSLLYWNKKGSVYWHKKDPNIFEDIKSYNYSEEEPLFSLDSRKWYFKPVENK